MPTPSIDELPPAPAPTDSRSAFSAKSFTFFGYMSTLRTQINAVVAWIADQVLAVASGSASAVAAQIAAEAAAANASATAGVTKWVSGTTYTDGATVWSPINSVTYRRRSTGAGTTDPSLDPVNWAIPTASSLPTQRINSNTAAQWGIHYIFEAACTLTLPLPGSNKDAAIGLSNVSGLYTGCIVDFTTGKLRGASPGAMTLSDPQLAFTLQDTGSTTYGYTSK